MRIPVYRSQAQLSDRAPGARITARKNASPFINAELQKGAVLTEVASQAALYSQERHKAIVEAQRNEAVFGAKEKLLQASFSFGNDDDIYNIFDGKKKYDVTVKKIFEDSLKAVGNNKYAQEDFKNAFNSFELAERFRLKGRIDEKIDARVQTSLKSLKDQQIAVLGDPYADYTLDDTIFQTAGLQNIFDKAAEKGMIPEALRANISPGVLSEALKKAIPAYASANMRNALMLSEVARGFAAVEAGQMTLEDFQKVVAEKAPGVPAHVLNLMQAVPMDEVNDVIRQTINNAASEEKAKINLQKKVEERFNKNVKSGYNRYFYYLSFDNQNKDFDVQEIKDFLPDIITTDLQGNFISSYIPNVTKEDGKFIAEGSDIAKGIQEYLGNLNELTPDMLNKMENFGKTTTQERKNDPAAFDALTKLDAEDGLTTTIVSSLSDKLTPQTYLNFINAAESEVSQGLSESRGYITRSLEFIEAEFIRTDIDKELAQQVSNQIDRLHNQLDDEIRNARIDGNPLSKTQIEERTRELLAGNSPRYKNVILTQYAEQLEFAAGTDFKFTPISNDLKNAQTPQDAITILENWYDSLSNPTNQNETDYTQYKRSFNSLAKKLAEIERMSE